jgi:hypothetical protein
MSVPCRDPQDAATAEAWGYVADGLERALRVPNLPRSAFDNLQRTYRLACALADRQVLSAASPTAELIAFAPRRRAG